MNIKSFIRRAAGMCLSATLLLTGIPLLVSAEEASDEKITFDTTPVKVACVGASTTEGTKGHSYPAYLQIMLGNGFEVRNFGYPGCSVTKGGQFSYIGSSYYTNSLAYNADIVIIDMGVNDSQPGYWKGGNNNFQSDYDDLVSAYMNQDNKPLVLLSTGGHCTKPSWGTDDKVIETGIQPAQIAVAEKYGLPTADLRAVLTSDPDRYIDDEDGVHYTGAGYKAMAQLYYDELVKLIELPQGEGVTGLIDPPNRQVEIAEYDGYRTLQWLEGQTGGFSYDSGILATALDIAEGTVVKNLAIDVTYFWDWKSGGNDWWYFNTTDKDGLSAPSVDGANPNDNGFGTLAMYGMQKGKWALLSVSRDDQTLGSATGEDWSVLVRNLESTNSLYIRGFVVTATLADGTQKSVTWGSPMLPADTTALQAAVDAALTDEELAAYSEDSVRTYKNALATAKALLTVTGVTQEDADKAVADLAAAEAALAAYTLGDLNEDDKVDSSDARIVLQAAVGKVTLTDTQKAAADVNVDGSIDSSDARVILQVAVGKAEL